MNIKKNNAMSSSSDQKGEYERIDQDTFWTSPQVAISTGGWSHKKFELEIFKWKSFQPTDAEYKRELEGKTVRIGINEYKIHTRPDGEIGQEQRERTFKLNIAKFKEMKGHLQDCAKTLLSEATYCLKEEDLLHNNNNNNITPSQWNKLRKKLHDKLAAIGWFVGCSVPITPDHVKTVLDLRKEHQLHRNHGQSFRCSLLTFKNPANKHADTEDSMIVTLQTCNDKGIENFRQRFMQASKPESRVHYLAATFQLSAALQRVCGQKLVDADTILLIAPALFALLEYSNRNSNILTKNLPLAFAEPIEMPIDNNQAICLAKDDGTLDNKILRCLQMENLQYMNNAKQLPLCPGIISSQDLFARQDQHHHQGQLTMGDDKENQVPSIVGFSEVDGIDFEDINPEEINENSMIVQTNKSNKTNNKSKTKVNSNRKRPSPPPPFEDITNTPPVKQAKLSNRGRKPKQQQQQQQQQKPIDTATTTTAIIDESMIASVAQQSVDHIRQQQQQQQQQEYFQEEEQEHNNDAAFQFSTQRLIEKEINAAAAAAAAAGAAPSVISSDNMIMQTNNNNNKRNRSGPLSHSIEL